MKKTQTIQAQPAVEQVPVASALVAPAPKAKRAAKPKAQAAPVQAVKPARTAKVAKPERTPEQIAAEKAELARRAEARKVQVAEEAAKARATAHEVIQALIAKETERRLCLCGCGAQTPRAFFVPGHDAKLLSMLLKGDVPAHLAA